VTLIFYLTEIEIGKMELTGIH